MIHSFTFEGLPKINNIYTVRRNTIWKIADTNHILIMILEGNCCFKINSDKYIVKKGDCIFIPKNTLYERSPYENQKCKMLYIHFETSGELCELSDKEAYIDAEKNQNEAELMLINQNAVFLTSYVLYLKPHMTGNHELQLLMETVEKLLTKITLENSLKIVLHFCEILFELSKLTVNTFKSDPSKDQVVIIPYNLKKAALYIKQNSYKRISISELAKHCNISQSQLTRYFKQAFGKSPIQYINDYKLNCAKHMLMYMQQLSVGAIAESLGFDDQRYFSRLFFKTFNETPTEYRYRVTHYVEKKDGE